MTKMTHGRVPRGLVSVRADGGSQPDVKALVESLNKAFADFKAEHNKQLEEIKKGNADALQALKVDNINADITRLQAAVDQANTQMAAFQMGGGGAGSDVADAEYTDSFRAHFRKGEVQAALNKGAADEMKKLAALNGAAFDKAYVANEVAFHGTVNGALKSTLIPSAHNAQLKSLLETGLTLFTEHQHHAEHLAAELK